MPERDYRFRVGKPGETDLSASTNVDLEFTTTGSTIRITRLNEWGGQKVTGVEARAESLPWEIGVAESSTGLEVTGSLNLSTAVKGPDMMRRTVNLDVREGGSTASFKTDAGGRITDLSVERDTQEYRFSIQDELFRARTASAFDSTNTTQMFPRGPHDDWWRIGAAKDATWEIVETTTEGGSTEVVKIQPFKSDWKLTRGEVGEIADDVVSDPKPGQNNFRNLSLRTSSGTTASIVMFLGAGATPQTPAQGLQNLAEDAEDDEWIEPGLVVALADSLPNSGEFNGFLHAFGRSPSTILPRHIGGATGIDPMQFKKDIYDEESVRVQSTLFTTHSSTNPEGLLDHPLKLDDIYVRVTSPTTSLQEWMRENINKPHGVADLIDTQGRIAPKYVRQPDADLIPQTTDLFTFTSTNIADRHPTWRQGTQEQVTRILFRSDQYTKDRRNPPVASDRVRTRDYRREFSHETTAFGEHTRKIELTGFQDITRSQGRIRRDLFQRFGNGPIRTEFHGMSDASTVAAGDFVVLDVPTMPKAPDSIRGGKQIFQILSRSGTPAGPRFEAIELGPEAQPISAPTLSMSKSSTEPKHAVDATVTNLSSGAEWEVRLAAQATEPAGSSEWTVRDFTGDSTSAVTRSQFPSGETIWGQARAKKENRIASAWSTAASATLDSITAPTTLTVTSTNHNEAEWNWANGSTEYDTEVTLDSTVQKRKIAGSLRARVTDLSTHSSTETLTGGVRHVDQFGGRSSLTTDTFSMSTNRDSPAVQSLQVADGYGV